jgi:hypothetical protein
MILWAAVVGAMLGAGGGLAQAWSGQWSHNFALWNHGHDGDHVYMSSLDGAGREAFVAYLYENVCSPGSFHSSEVRDIATHVHVDGANGICTNTSGGSYRSPQTGLAHHHHT